MNSGLQFYDGMTSTEIQSILIKSAADLISLETPNYQYVAARLLLFQIRKSVFNTKWKDSKIYPPLKDIVVRNINYGVYDDHLINYYDDEDWDKLEGYMKHDRDFLFTYAGLRQVVDKYLVQDRSSGQLFESPQYMYMLISLFYLETIQKKRGYLMSKYITMQFQHLKSTFRHLLWLVLELLYDSLLLVYWLILMILWTVFLVLIWLLVVMLLSVRELVLMLVEYEDWVRKLEVVRYNIQESFRFLKNLNRQFVVAFQNACSWRVFCSSIWYQD